MSDNHPYLNQAHREYCEKVLALKKQQTPMTREEAIKQAKGLAKASKRDKSKPYIPSHMEPIP